MPVPRNVYTVAQVNRYVKNLFAQDLLLRSLYVRGEVSNCKHHTSGHIYFTLKDETGTLSCVMFAGNASRMRFRLRDGQQVVVSGQIDVYEKTGAYQLYARDIIPEGTGLLQERYEQLKRELEELGMFSREYKQEIPVYPRTIGVVTAQTGAAVRDIIQIAKRRNPFVQIILYPAQVQGEGAAESIVRGIRALERCGVDVMIVGRGGGSIEDLWAFNERIVAQAIFDCTVPIISAVGHETDFTIADFVADLRAPTPSAAAELAAPDIGETLAALEDCRAQMRSLMSGRVRRERLRADRFRDALRLMSPEGKLRGRREDLVRIEERLERALRERIEEAREEAADARDVLSRRMRELLTDRMRALERYCERMKGLSPISRLQSGFSYVADESGSCVRSVAQAQAGELLVIHVTDGRILARTERTERTDGWEA